MTDVTAAVPTWLYQEFEAPQSAACGLFRWGFGLDALDDAIGMSRAGGADGHRGLGQVFLAASDLATRPY